MDLRKSMTGFVRGLFLLTVFVTFMAISFWSQPSEAKVSQAMGQAKTCTNATNCHGNASASGTLQAAWRNVTAPTAYQTSGQVSAAVGDVIEVDWVFTGISGGTNGVQLNVPTTWTVTLGAASSPPLTPWHTSYEGLGTLVNGTGWANDLAGTDTYITAYDGGNPDPYDSGNSDTANNDGSETDNQANQYGADMRITVPVGASGVYTIYYHGIGHDAGSRAYLRGSFQVNVGGSDSSAPVPNNDVAVSVESGTYVPAAFDVTATFVDAESAVTSCEYTLNNGGAWSAGVVSGAGPYTCTANVTGQADAATLNISMRATSSGGLSAASTYYPTRTVDAVGPVQNVGTPLAAATGATGEIDLTWGTATDAGVGLHATLPYRIRQLAGATPPNADCTSDGTEIYSGTALLHTDASLPVSSQYSYRLCTYDLWDQLTAGGQTATATSGAGTTPPDTTISAPTASAVLSGASFNITGTATAGTNPLQDVLVSTDGGATYPNTATGTAAWSWSWTLPSEDYVAHTIMAKARDNQGTPLEDPSPASVAIFVDTVTPTGLSLNTPLDTATGVSTTPSLTVNAATDGNPTIEYQFEVAEDSGFSVALQTSAWQAGTSWSPAALSSGTVHYWRATARDGAGNTTAATGTRTFTTAAGCVPAQPTVSLAPGAQTITNDGGLVVYTVTVTNNDSACADATFTLSVNDTNGTEFYTSVLNNTSMTIASGAFDTTTVTVQTIPGNDAVTNDTTVTATDSPTHDPAVVSAAVTTTVTLGGGCVGTGNNSNATSGGTLITGR